MYIFLFIMVCILYFPLAVLFGNVGIGLANLIETFLGKRGLVNGYYTNYGWNWRYEDSQSFFAFFSEILCISFWVVGGIFLLVFLGMRI